MTAIERKTSTNNRVAKVKKAFLSKSCVVVTFTEPTCSDVYRVLRNVIKEQKEACVPERHPQFFEGDKFEAGAVVQLLIKHTFLDNLHWRLAS